jgi:hypothetical protein
MSLKKQIADWFEKGCHFHDGVDLLRATGGDVRPFFRAMNSPSPDAYSRQKLKDALNKAVLGLSNQPISDVPPEKKSYTGFNTEIPSAKRAVFTQNEPESVTQLRERARMLHKRHSLVHAQLLPAPDEKARLKLAEEIMEDILPQLDEIYDSIRAWEKDGVAPAPGVANDVVKETVEKMKRVQSLESRLSRLKGLIKNTTIDRDRADYEKEQLAKQVELADLKAELKL